MKNFEIPALVPELIVRNFERSQRFYLDVASFRIEYARPENKFAMLSLERSWIMIGKPRLFTQ